MSDKTVYSNAGTAANQFAALTASWAALPASTFPTADVTGFGTFTTSSNRWTAPASDLPDGVLVLMGLQSEDSSNGRVAFALRGVNISGTGDIVSGQGGGYSRDTSEDRAYARSWAYIDAPSASSVWEIQARRSSDAPGTGDEFVTGDVQFIPIYRSAVGMYTSQTTQTFGGTTFTRATGWSSTKQSDTTSIELGATTANVVDLKGDNTKYLILGSLYMDAASNRTQRVAQLRADSVARAQGVTYLRSATSSPNGTSIFDGIETATATIGIDMAACRGIGVAARQGGADSDQTISTAETELALVVIELNSSAEWIRTHSTSQQECALTGPVDLNLADVVDFNDSASFTKASASAINCEQAMDVVVFGNINCPRNTQSIGSGTRWTAFADWTVNGTEQARTKDGDYNRGNQSTTDTHGWSAHPAGVLTVANGDDLGVSVTELVGSEGGAGDIETEPFANNEGLSFIALNLDSLESAGPTTHTASGGATLPAVTASGTSKVIRKASGAATIAALVATGAAGLGHPASGAATLTALEAAGTAEITTSHTASGGGTLTALEASGTAKVHRAASSGGTPVFLTALEASGTAKVRRAASGLPRVPAVEMSGSAKLHHFAMQPQQPPLWPKITGPTAAGTATVIPAGADHTASGGGTLTALEASGTAKVHRAASGTPALTALEASGTAATQGIATASGGGTLTALEAAGTAKVHRAASGTPSLTALEAAGTAATQGIATASGGGTLTAIEAAGTAKVHRAASGTPALTALEASGTAARVILAEGNTTDKDRPTIGAISGAGNATVTPTGATHTASGGSTLTALEASGTAKVHRAASGGSTLAAILAAGEACKPPRVYLNTTRTLVGATEMVVTDYNSAGTSITFTDPLGAPTGALWLAVENTNNGEVGWIAVNVTPTAADHTASGGGTITALLASGTAELTRNASGGGTLLPVEASGTATVHRAASGGATLTAIYGEGAASLQGSASASGGGTLAPVEASGAATIHRAASGGTNLPALEASGTAETVATASGGVDLPPIEAAGTATVHRAASGNATLTPLEAAGAAGTVGMASAAGGSTLTALEASGTAELTRKASGNATMPAAEASGTAGLALKASGNANVPVPFATGTASGLETASGGATLGALESAGTATVHRAASGGATLTPVEAAGIADTYNLKTASGGATLGALEASGAAIKIEPIAGQIEGAGEIKVGSKGRYFFASTVSRVIIAPRQERQLSTLRKGRNILAAIVRELIKRRSND